MTSCAEFLTADGLVGPPPAIADFVNMAEFTLYSLDTLD